MMVGTDGRTEDFILPVGIGRTQRRRQLIAKNLLSVCPVFVSIQYIVFLLNGGYGNRTVVADFRSLTTLSFFRSDNNDTVGSTGAINGCSRSIFQYRKRLNIFRVHHRKPVRHTFDPAVIDGQSVNHNQRIVAGIQGRTSTDTNLCTSTRSSVIGNHTHTGYLSSQHILCIGGNTLTQFIRLDSCYRTGGIILLHRTVTDNHHIIQHFRIILKRHIHGSLCRKFLRLISDKGNDNYISFLSFQCKITIQIRNRTHGSSLHQHIGTDNTHTGIVFHYSFHDKPLCKGLQGKENSDYPYSQEFTRTIQFYFHIH